MFCAVARISATSFSNMKTKTRKKKEIRGKNRLLCVTLPKSLLEKARNYRRKAGFSTMSELLRSAVARASAAELCSVEKEEKTQISFRLPEELYANLFRAANRSGQSTAKIVRRLLESAPNGVAPANNPMKTVRLVPPRRREGAKLLFCALCALFAVPAVSFAATDWVLVFSDEFDGDALDEAKWTRTPKQNSNWNQYMDDSDPALAEIRDGCLVLKGTKDTADPNVRDYREAGVWTRDTFTLQYGKVEFRARFDSVQGGKDGVENKDWSFGVTPGIDKTVFNTYGVEWEPGEIRFFVNGKLTGTFTKENTSAEHWPFDKEDNGFYLIMSMQIGGNWVENAGENKGIDAATLHSDGAEIEIDYVRVWQDSSMVPEPSAAGLFAGTLALVCAASSRRRRRGKTCASGGKDAAAR